MRAAREKDFSDFSPPEASSSVLPDTDMSEASIGSPLLQQPQQQKTSLRVHPTYAQFPTPQFPPRTPPPSIWEGNSASGSSTEFIQIIDPANGAEHPFPVKYTGLYTRGRRFNFISAEAVKRFHDPKLTSCDFSEHHGDAPAPSYLFVSTCFIELQWYRREWLESGDNSTEWYRFYIVNCQMPFPVLLGDPCPRSTRVPSEYCSYTLSAWCPLLKWY
jgi:hypothetical protein